MPNITVSISVDEQYRDKLSEVIENCKKLGLNIEQQLDAIGIITGSIDSGKIDELKQVQGVSKVELSREIRIAPPDSEIQ